MTLVLPKQEDPHSISPVSTPNRPARISTSDMPAPLRANICPGTMAGSKKANGLGRAIHRGNKASAILRITPNTGPWTSGGILQGGERAMFCTTRYSRLAKRLAFPSRCSGQARGLTLFRPSEKISSEPLWITPNSDALRFKLRTASITDSEGPYAFEEASTWPSIPSAQRAERLPASLVLLPPRTPSLAASRGLRRTASSRLHPGSRPLWPDRDSSGSASELRRGGPVGPAGQPPQSSRSPSERRPSRSGASPADRDHISDARGASTATGERRMMASLQAGKALRGLGPLGQGSR